MQPQSSKPVDRHARERMFVRRTRGGMWLLMLSMHLGYAVAYGFEVRYYSDTITNPLYFTYLLRVFGRNQQLNSQVNVAVLISSSLITAWHVAAVYSMIRISMQKRKIFFPIPRPRAKSSGTLSFSRTQGLIRLVLLPFRQAMRWWEDYCGVDGAYFEVASDVRESIEIGTQTYVVYRLSRFVDHEGLNRFASLMLVANCWSTPVVRGLFRSSKHGPLIRTIVGTILASVFTVMLPGLLFIPYYSLALAPQASRYDPKNFINRGNLFQQLFILNWNTWISTRVAALLAIISLQTVKRKLGEIQPRRQSTRPTSVAAIQPVDDRAGAAWPSAPVVEASERDATANMSALFSAFGASQLFARSRTVERLANGVFSAIGLAVLVLHIRASSHSSPPMKSDGFTCTTVLRPWFHSASICAVLDVNCHRLGIRGVRSDWDSVLTSPHLVYLMGFRVSHCSELEIPSVVRQLGSVINVVLFNNTLATWDEDASFTHLHNPAFSSLTMVQTRNISRLPPGLHAPDSPVISFEISGSDLADLPPDLRAMWPAQMEHVVIEHSQLSHVPVALTQLRTGRLSLASNRIAQLPRELFDSHDYYRSLTLSNNPIASLPATVNGQFRAYDLSLIGTNVTELPQWIADAVDRGQISILLAKGTALCDQPASSVSIQCGDPDTRTREEWMPLQDIIAMNPP